MDQQTKITFPKKMQFCWKVTQWLGISDGIVDEHANIIEKLQKGLVFLVELLTKKLHQKVRLLLATESAMKLKNKKNSIGISIDIR